MPLSTYQVFLGGAHRNCPGDSAPIVKRYRAGTHRVIEPDETLARIRPLWSRFGITRVANITGLDRVGVPVVQACRPNSRSLAVSQGKGLGLAAAKASALMEAIEAYHAEHIALPLKYARFADLSRDHCVVEPKGLNRPKNSSYHPELPLLWIEGFDLLQSESVWLPFEMVDANYTFPRPAGTGCFAATSNGLASGNHLIEAISHGICEVVERDATTLWALSGEEAQDQTRVDLHTVDDPACQDVLERFRSAGLVTALWETSSDVGIPCFLCKIREDAHAATGNFELPGYGCHPVLSIALFRALTEAAQTRLALIAGTRDDLGRSKYEQMGNPLISWQDRTWFQDQGSRSLSQASSFDAETFDQDLDWLLDRLRQVGIRRVIAVDLTKPDVNVPVVRIVIPGMEMALIDPQRYAFGERAQSLLQQRP